MMIKRLFKIEDKEIIKDRFYENVLRDDNVSYPTTLVIKAILDRAYYFIKSNDISSKMQILVIYRKPNNTNDSKYDVGLYRTEYLDFRFCHKDVNKPYVRCMDVTNLIAMNTKDYLVDYSELECNAKIEFYRLFNEFRDMIKMNKMEKPEDVAMYRYCYNDAIATEDALKKMAEAKEALKKYGGGNFEQIPAHYCPEIERVIFQEPATIVFWKDGSKTVVKVQKGEKYDPEKGLAMAYVKRLLGNCYSYYDVFKKNLPKEYRKKAAKSKK